MRLTRIRLFRSLWILAIMSTTLTVGAGAKALAQDATTRAVEQGGVPTGGALWAALAIGTVMSGAIGKLWLALRDQAKEHHAALEKQAAAHDAALEKIGNVRDSDREEHRSEVAALRDRLGLEQKERREEAERLLREQKEIMREVMTTCSAITTALAGVTDAVKALLSRVPN